MRSGPPRHRGRGGPHGRRNARRTRWTDDAGAWHVLARVERFVEPALLLVLREGSTHGYDLAEAIEELTPGERVDLGNLYRLLRSLEEEGVVTSEWRDDLPGRSKRSYQLTARGEDLLEAWVDALADLTGSLSAFRQRHDQGVDT
jgi:DNA-binding PadR family transcriptional regulator